ncbi:MAG: hypothetical protein JOY56_01210 [Solirubrobacterales bacterium]|nr:hypothetical protein [Solirubrobacterales bacterium]MBV9364754.1 hypothetical protein [Solirubrobacterales bacterium]MBV9684838.1 hypothetical protein [Solirubrobacterales bacterium]
MIAFSTFDQPVPPESRSSLYAANLALRIKTPHPHTVWWTAPNAHSARCSSANGANLLEISPRHGP